MIMPEGGLPNNLEQELAQIEQQLAEKRAVLGQQKEAGQIAELPHEKETLREVIGERIGAPAVPSTGTSVQPPTSNLPPPIIVDSPSYLSPELKEKVQELVNLAFTHTPDIAIKQARATNNAALIDAFHDALVDELYNYLVERGKLTKLQ